MRYLGFCILLSTIVACDTWIFLKGFEAFFHKAKTKDEKLLLEAIRKKAQLGE